eukprot:SAG11_NODE_34950_length_269_cov_0.611765_1_plen_52_part_01
MTHRAERRFDSCITRTFGLGTVGVEVALQVCEHLVDLSHLVVPLRHFLLERF